LKGITPVKQFFTPTTIPAEAQQQQRIIRMMTLWCTAAVPVMLMTTCSTTPHRLQPCRLQPWVNCKMLHKRHTELYLWICSYIMLYLTNGAS